jgi:heterotetrameric sarcosine oxidase gamma subunit
MMQWASGIVTDFSLTVQPPALIFALEIWSNPQAVAERFESSVGFALPPMGRSGENDRLRLIRFEPTVWLVEGEISDLEDVLGNDGALTAIGGGIVRIHLSGSNWRALLMEGGIFDAENKHFAPGCSAATIIDHVPVRLHVVNDALCVAYVPASFSAGLLHFWHNAATHLV